MESITVRGVRELSAGTWEVDMRSDACKRYRKRVHAASREAAVAAGRSLAAETAGCITLGDAIDRYLDTAPVSADSIKQERCFTRRLGDLLDRRIDSFTTAEVEETFARLDDDYAHATNYQAKLACARAARLAVADGLAATDPFTGAHVARIAPSKRREIPERDAKAIKTIAAYGFGPAAAAIGLAFGCGLSAGEIAGILNRDLDPNERTVTVRGCWREHKAAPDTLLDYETPKAVLMPKWLAEGAGTWRYRWGERFLLESGGHRISVGPLRIAANDLLKLTGLPYTLFELRCGKREVPFGKRGR